MAIVSTYRPYTCLKATNFQYEVNITKKKHSHVTQAPFLRGNNLSQT